MSDREDGEFIPATSERTVPKLQSSEEAAIPWEYMATHRPDEWDHDYYVPIVQRFVISIARRRGLPGIQYADRGEGTPGEACGAADETRTVLPIEGALGEANAVADEVYVDLLGKDGTEVAWGEKWEYDGPRFRSYVAAMARHKTIDVDRAENPGRRRIRTIAIPEVSGEDREHWAHMAQHPPDKWSWDRHVTLLERFVVGVAEDNLRRALPDREYRSRVCNHIASNVLIALQAKPVPWGFSEWGSDTDEFRASVCDIIKDQINYCIAIDLVSLDDDENQEDGGVYGVLPANTHRDWIPEEALRDRIFGEGNTQFYGDLMQKLNAEQLKIFEFWRDRKLLPDKETTYGELPSDVLVETLDEDLYWGRQLYGLTAKYMKYMAEYEPGLSSEAARKRLQRFRDVYREIRTNFIERA